MQAWKNAEAAQCAVVAERESMLEVQAQKHESELQALAAEFQKSIADMRASFAAAADQAASAADQAKSAHMNELKCLRNEYAASRQELVASHTAAVQGHEATIAALRQEQEGAREANQIALSAAQTKYETMRKSLCDEVESARIETRREGREMLLLETRNTERHLAAAAIQRTTRQRQFRKVTRALLAQHVLRDEHRSHSHEQAVITLVDEHRKSKSTLQSSLDDQTARLADALSELDLLRERNATLEANLQTVDEGKQHLSQKLEDKEHDLIELRKQNHAVWDATSSWREAAYSFLRHFSS
eukprot:SAG31_NODE_6240_length_2107_cov_1.253486_4_plen_301_part_01